MRPLTDGQLMIESLESRLRVFEARTPSPEGEAGVNHGIKVALTGIIGSLKDGDYAMSDERAAIYSALPSDANLGLVSIFIQELNKGTGPDSLVSGFEDVKGTRAVVLGILTGKARHARRLTAIAKKNETFNGEQGWRIHKNAIADYYKKKDKASYWRRKWA